MQIDIQCNVLSSNLQLKLNYLAYRIFKEQRSIKSLQRNHQFSRTESPDFHVFLCGRIQYWQLSIFKLKSYFHKSIIPFLI